MSITFSQLATRFLVWAAKCKRPSTVAVYRHYLRRFVEHHGDMPAADVRPCHVTEFAKSWHDAQAVKRLYRWAVDEAGILETNHVARVKHPPKGMRRRINTPAETARLLRAVKHDLRALLIGYRETMARPEELRKATWEDVAGEHPSENVGDALARARASIVLYEFKRRDARKESSAPRVILLSPRVCRLLLRLWKRNRHKTGPIFSTARGRAWTPNAVRCRFRRLRVKLNIQRDKRGESIVPYTFRHTAATMAAAAGVRDRWLTHPLGPFALYVAPLAAIAAEWRELPRNSDEHPVIEWLSARAHAGGAGKPAPFTGLAFAGFARGLREAATTALAALSPAARRAGDGGHALQSAGALHVAGRAEEAGQALAAAAALLPPELFAEAAPDPSVAEAWH